MSAQKESRVLPNERLVLDPLGRKQRTKGKGKLASEMTDLLVVELRDNDAVPQDRREQQPSEATRRQPDVADPRYITDHSQPEERIAKLSNARPVLLLSNSPDKH